MDKEEFYKISDMEKINYINGQLQQGLNKTAITKDLAIDIKVIHRLIKRIGFVWNEELKQYVVIDAANPPANAPVVGPAANGVTKMKSPTNNVVAAKADKIKELESKIALAHDRLDKMEKMISDINPLSTFVEYPSYYTGKSMQSSIRVDAGLWKKFLEYAGTQPNKTNKALMDEMLIEYLAKKIKE